MIDETAINSAEQALVTAKKRTISKAAAPDFPSNADAAAAAGRPADTSAGVKTIESGPLSATAARPSVVAKVKGMANLFKFLVLRFTLSG
jgi:hypothetical protein